jgi:hypothetical protein
MIENQGWRIFTKLTQEVPTKIENATTQRRQRKRRHWDQEDRDQSDVTTGWGAPGATRS